MNQHDTQAKKKAVEDERSKDLNLWKIIVNQHQVPSFNSEKEKEWTSPWYFIQGADPQYGFFDYKSDDPNLEKEIQMTESLVQKINNLNPKPRFFVICGDLVNSSPSSNCHLFNREKETFNRIFGKIDPSIPVLLACGNHDIGDIPTAFDIKEYRNCWGDDYYSFWCGGIFFLVINSQYYKNICNVVDYADKHNEWLEKELKLICSKKDGRSIVLQHTPWFLKSAEESDDYFTINKSIRGEMLEYFVSAGVQKIFCGHLHRNVIGMYKDLEIIVTSAICGQLGSDKAGIRLIKVYKDKIEHVYYATEDIPCSIQL